MTGVDLRVEDVDSFDSVTCLVEEVDLSVMGWDGEVDLSVMGWVGVVDLSVMGWVG